MLGWLSNLNGEMIAGGIVGLGMIGVIARNAIFGWVEARNKLRSAEVAVSPIAAAMALSWDRNQIDKVLSFLERIAEAQEIQIRHAEAIAKSQGILSDQFQQTTHMKLNQLLERLEEKEKKTPPSTRRR